MIFANLVPLQQIRTFYSNYLLCQHSSRVYCFTFYPNCLNLIMYDIQLMHIIMLAHAV